MNITMISREEITIRGQPSEIEALEGMVNGAQWVKGDKSAGALTIDAYKALPVPQDDPLLPPQWQRSEGTIAHGSARLVDHVSPDEGWHSPSFVVQHLCAYGFTVEKYRAEAVKMQQLGFECLRSRRSRDGKFWELWFLPGSWAAKGALAEQLKLAREHDWKAQSRVIMDYVQKHVVAGTTDVCVQRLAMSIE
jgi:hypothetical protein